VNVASQGKPHRPAWRVHFFQRHVRDDPARTVPALVFLDGCPLGVRTDVQAVLAAVAAAPPPSFSGGGMWKAMHGEMAGYNEVRVMGPNRHLYRLFCVLERPGQDLGGPSIVAIAGLTKRPGTAITAKDYRKVRQLGEEFAARRTVLR
jgi:hypothetical protein